ncbi:hypothetical protein AAFF_G00304170 [Aldrovandia affinis]|uniref:Uncharacterized protein n=1 Tax=Aldrovandia affinis TaxID=143900 RepID=A0AAD7SP89_9TELE|nr:hypothetical protein AAFF_G00304170 [Aldrovandia affinis]
MNTFDVSYILHLAPAVPARDVAPTEQEHLFLSGKSSSVRRGEPHTAQRVCTVSRVTIRARQTHEVCRAFLVACGHAPSKVQCAGNLCDFAGPQARRSGQRRTSFTWDGGSQSGPPKQEGGRWQTTLSFVRLQNELERHRQLTRRYAGAVLHLLSQMGTARR